MRIAATSICAGIVCALSASSTLALGFGPISSNTVLGQPLSFTVPLRMESDEFVSVECVSAEVYSGDARVPPAQVRVALDRAREGSDRVIRITTAALIDEPVVTIEVGVGCPVRLSRKFVTFIDPPVITLAEAPAPEAARAETAPADTTPPTRAAEQPFITPAPPARASRPPVQRPPRVATPRPARPVARPTVLAAANPASAPRARAATDPAAKVAPAAPAATAGARLQLEAAEGNRPPNAPVASASAPATPGPTGTTGTTVAPAAAQPAASQPEAQVLAQANQERDRMRLIEENMARLRTDTDAARNNIATLQARLREAEASRYSNPLVYGLIALIVLLILALATLLGWARAREKQRADWWAASIEESANRPRVTAPAPVQPLEREMPESVIPSGIVESMPSTAPAAGPMTWKPTLAIPELDKNEAPKRAVTAEELIDLEQQAEFFITLGQDDSAIDLLVGHLNSSGGISPLPYLKLLEIHRRRSDTAAYERIREHFNQRFNAYIPAFDASQTPARPLEEHPEVMAQLQEAWPTPPRAMGLLESLLFRQGGGDAAFDLAAYREVLFLHEVARDLYEHDTSPTTVDVLLPLDGDLSPSSSNPLVSTMAVTPNPQIERPIGVDVDLGRPRDEEAEEAAARAERRKERYGDSDFLFGSRTGTGYTDDVDKPGPRGRKGSK